MREAVPPSLRPAQRRRCRAAAAMGSLRERCARVRDGGAAGCGGVPGKRGLRSGALPAPPRSSGSSRVPLVIGEAAARYLTEFMCKAGVGPRVNSGQVRYLHNDSFSSVLITAAEAPC